MKLNAYLLAGDPNFVAASISSYYSLVDRIIVSHDVDRKGWSGLPINVDQTIEEATSADPAGKIVLLAGKYSDPTSHPLECETRQRQEALDCAGDGADWVLQLDGDEVLADPHEFLDSLAAADEAAFHALDFPSRWFYCRLPDGRYLEACRSFWGVAAHYPGPLAVRNGTQLRHCRQVAAPSYRVDFGKHNTDPARPRTAPVHRVVDPSQGVIHFSWVRSEEEMRAKSQFSGHRDDHDWNQELRRWSFSQRHPGIAVAATPWRRGNPRGRLRFASLPPHIPQIPLRRTSSPESGVAAR